MRRTAIVLAVAGSLALATDIRAQTTRIEGRVVDGASGVPIASAEVRLYALTGNTEYRAFTQDGGSFTITGVAAGRYVAQAHRIGYVLREDTVRIGVGAVERLNIILMPDPVPLPGVPAEGRTRMPPDVMAGFWERRDRHTGYFMTREDIDRLRPHRMADLFRRIPGTQIQLIGDGPVAISGRVRNADGRPCVPAMFVDGIPYVMTERGLDDFSPANIEAVEVYSGASRIPAQFNMTGRVQPRWRNDQIIGNPRCGVIVLWTRRASR
jgi:hypothetical protein